ncbi:MAG: hypothetical protein H6739_41570 [Alphaproteobacteria bacterium]|nr:hypothetical protein [Alphaproteobacteria bacterium]
MIGLALLGAALAQPSAELALRTTATSWRPESCGCVDRWTARATLELALRPGPFVAPTASIELGAGGHLFSAAYPIRGASLGLRVWPAGEETGRWSPFAQASTRWTRIIDTTQTYHLGAVALVGVTRPGPRLSPELAAHGARTVGSMAHTELGISLAVRVGLGPPRTRE